MSLVNRHASLSLEMLLKLVAIFGSVVFATVSAPPTVGVDLHAEQRFGPSFIVCVPVCHVCVSMVFTLNFADFIGFRRECCKECFGQLQKIQKILPLLIR